jgi:hypothetical protein
VTLGFGNQPTGQPREVEFQVGDSLQLTPFYNRPFLRELVNCDEKGKAEVAGYCQLVPKLISEKPIICPILCSSCSAIKLGDIEIQFRLTRSATSLAELQEISYSLDRMIEQAPQRFDCLYGQLVRDGFVCHGRCLSGS